MSSKTLNRRKKVHKRIRKTLSGTAARPRLSVFRSNKGIYAQLIDDATATTRKFGISFLKLELE